MAEAKEHESYQNYLEKLYDDDQAGTGELTQTESHNFEVEANDSVGRDIDNTGTIIMDAGGNYYYKSSENMVKVEPLANISDVAVKKIAAAIVLTPETSQKKAEKASASLNKNKLAANTSKNLNGEEIVSKSVDDTITSESPSQEEVYEFDENEPDPDNPGDITDPDYESKGIIKKEKKTKANEAASFTCKTCPYQTNKKYLLTRHLKSHSNHRPYKCSVCERDFKSNTALVNHRNTHLGFKPYGCLNCDMAFTTSGELIRHQRYRHTHFKPHKCTECDYSSVEMSKLRRHMRCHTGERPYQCPHCTYASPDTFKLKRHLRTHTGEKPYECDICHARFTQSNSLKHHRLIHSVNEKPVFQCQLCPTTCGRKTDLRQHIKKLHNSDQPIPCKKCGKELPDRYSYKMHIKTHEGEKCYRCEYCPYASISKRHLESHVFIHLNAKPFTCEICQSNFRQKSLLSRHMKIYHSCNYTPPEPRKKDHKCPHCNKMFAFNGNLMRHMEIHDPTSRLSEEKEKLKVGRMKRVNSDGIVVTASSPYEHLPKLFDDNEETEAQQQVDDEEYQEEYEEAEEYNEDNIQYVYDDYEADEYEGQDVEEQYEHQLDETNDRKLLIDVKQEKMEILDIAQIAVKKTLTIKNEESNDSEIMSLEVHDDQGYVVVEVMPDDDDDEEEEQQEQENIHQVKLQTVEPSTITKDVNQSTSSKTLQKSIQPLISDYFGFEVNAEEEDEETKGAIKLLEIIEQE